MPARAAVRTAVRVAAALVAAVPALPGTVAMAQGSPKLPGSLVYLRDVDPTIEQDIRYAQADNFTGGKVAATAPPNVFSPGRPRGRWPRCRPI